MRSGGCPAGSGRALRLDPFSLPVRFAASDAAADERVRHVELYRERVVVRRSLAGMRMALNMPVSAFAGVAIRAPDGGRQPHRLRRARTQGSLARAAAVRLGRGRRRLCRMAHLGQCAGPAVAGRRRRRRVARAVRAHGRRAHRARASAPPPPQRHQAPPALDAAAPRRPASSPTRRRCIAASARSSPRELDYLQRSASDPCISMIISSLTSTA